MLTVKKQGVDTPIVNAQKITVTTLYTSITANEGKGITKYTAADLGVDYLYAMEVHNIPTSGTFTLEIQAFSTEKGATESLYDDLVTVTIVDGEIQ